MLSRTGNPALCSCLVCQLPLWASPSLSIPSISQRLLLWGIHPALISSFLKFTSLFSQLGWRAGMAALDNRFYPSFISWVSFLLDNHCMQAKWPSNISQCFSQLEFSTGCYCSQRIMLIFYILRPVFSYDAVTSKARYCSLSFNKLFEIHFFLQEDGVGSL